jgi:hypothetical protein
MKKLLLAIAAVMAMTGANMASAATIVDQHLGTFGSPIEWRPTCVKWFKPWHGAKICIGLKFENLQHKFVLRVSGPAADEAVKRVLTEAVAAAAAAAVAAGVVTPSPEPAARIAAGLAAAKTAFVGYLTARGLELLLNQYSIALDHETYWS